MWVRGLKQKYAKNQFVNPLVAPYVGAWIETTDSGKEQRNTEVAPYVGAWIETL